jgi:hypothetical protein
MRKFFFCLMAGTLFAAPVFGTHLVDSIRVSVSSGSHTISTASFPNGVWFQLPGGVRESSKTSPPFPTVGPGGTITVTFNLLSDPDTVIGANFDMSMDGVPHPGQNLFTGASWLAHLNVFGDLIGHAPNDADIRYQLVPKADPAAITLTLISPSAAPIRGAGNQSINVLVKAVNAPSGTMVNVASSDPSKMAVSPAFAMTGPDSTAQFTLSVTAFARSGDTGNLTFTTATAAPLVVPVRVESPVPALTPVGLFALGLILAGTALFYFRRRRTAAA